MEKNKKFANNKIMKFLLVLKRFWYIILISIIGFGAMGFLFGNIKYGKTGSSQNQQSYVTLKTQVVISDNNYQEYSDSFNKSCVYFMTYASVRLSAVRTVNSEMTDSEAVKSIDVTALSGMLNMVEISIKYSNKDDAKLILDSYIEKAEDFLNETLKNGMDEIRITQAGNINYFSYEANSKESKMSIIKFTILGSVAGVAFAIILLYFWKFYFCVHSPTDVIKNIKIDYIGTFSGSEELKDYSSKNKELIFCNSGKEKILNTENCYTKEEIFNNVNLCEDKELVIIVKESKDTLFYIEKLQLLLKNKIRGFVIYK